ncbi:cysteine--1-D-myo-inosityl 2-amino-2-deoxy-alpha-D-glucopyranoside ligase [Nocardioides mangrovicus]|uniref:L-cysteine:1D-myo-inositol 2-amino-2-deoxy-alpha-D-glucopyranoside ligase n=1 Tax=Nocardioides mangrovicus TaxID=2478913 RepID=A0A3L8NZV6_9ACTN|nr:cysteine--1-D-myo-inosityl 2-amino-2-deoxy-alpha-D-glucopyranoside ligase [Nocardioides mangrovicus]RLV48716.1 cysteine--1-D-myo-inosityl 2-amino-2-deoxy-alpha-D-glucopyranoside ligase [Nocardioides mangrovicus]
MRAWTSVAVPALPVVGPAVQVFDTAAGDVVATTPTDAARMYVCGITPYDATHLGHAATYVAFDLLNRAWRSAGHAVHYVQNVTDVDDPLLERAEATGEDWVALAERETDLFRTDMEALRVLAPDAYVGAVEAIPLIIPMIEQLQAAGAVYDVEGDLYFSVSADPRFGSESRWTREQMMAVFAERGGDPDRRGKKDPLDCLLWQLQRPGEPGWESPFGRGRPGWHVECSAIARHHLGAPLDVQGGGSDLVFPHHEMSASQSQVAQPQVPFAHHYVHSGMVALDGEKMSKSKGNLELVSRLREQGADPMAVRLALMRHHYRSDWEWTPQQLADATTTLATLRAAVARPAAPADQVVTEVLAALADDLDAPRALGALEAWAATPGDDRGAGDVVRVLADAALGLAL